MPKPNILLITADQWRGDCLGVAGHPVLSTPALDALAEESTRFSRHYAPCAPCAPARASLYTGLYQFNHGVTSNGVPLDNRFDNVARAARRAGYRPTLFGYTDTALDPRVHAGQDPQVSTYEEVLPGFELAQGYREDHLAWRAWLAERGYDPAVCDDPLTVPQTPGQRVSSEPAPWTSNHSPSAFLIEAFERWHWQQLRSETPWFAHVSLFRPHPPYVVPAPWNTHYAPERCPLPIPGPDPGRLQDYRLHDPLIEHYRKVSCGSLYLPDIPGNISALCKEDFQRIRALYYGMISETDEHLGRLFSLLRQTGQWQNTLVVFTSDHGEMLGDHGMLGKGGYFEQSQHIPLLIKTPENFSTAASSAHHVDAMTSAVDIFPTLLDFLGVKPETANDGLSLCDWLDGGSAESWRQAVVWEHDCRHWLAWEDDNTVAAEQGTDRQHDDAGSGSALSHRVDERSCSIMALRTRQNLYVQSPALPERLFDLAEDSQCLNDLASREQSINIRLELSQYLLHFCLGLRDKTLHVL